MGASLNFPVTIKAKILYFLVSSKSVLSNETLSSEYCMPFSILKCVLHSRRAIPG